jgi:hypothetical protein
VVGVLNSSALAGAYRIRVRGKLAYVSASSAGGPPSSLAGGVAVVDISNPLKPRLLASYIDPEHLHTTTGLDLDPTGSYLVAASPYLAGQEQPLYPPFALQAGGPVLEGTVSVITLDPEPIQATISVASEPPGSTTQTSANFSFSANDAVATVQCRLDGGAWTLCTTPTSQSYPTLSDGPHSFQVQATDSAGTTSTAAYSWVITAPPANTTPPSIAGSAVQGQLLSASAGVWSGYPAPSFGYAWERCNASGGACVPIEGASEPTYQVAAADVGSTLVLVVTASNVYGSSAAQSAPSATVMAPTTGGGSSGGSGGTAGGGSVGGSSGASSGGSGAAGGTGLLGSQGAAPTTAQIQAALLGALLPSGKAGRIASVRKHRGYQVTFNAPAPGVVVISWYELPKGVHLASAKPILVATGRMTVTTKGTVKVMLKLTARGKGLLKHGRQIKLTGRGAFTLAGRSPVVVTKAFTLR